MAEERRLLVAGDATDRNARAEQQAVGHVPARGHDCRKQRAVDAEELEQPVVPLERGERAEQRARSVRPIGRMHLTPTQLPDEPRVDGAEGEAGPPVLAQEPLELRRREVRVRHEAGPLADQSGVELAAALSGTAVLPDDRRPNRMAGRALPEQRRLALVRDPDRFQVGRADARGCERRFGSPLDAEPDLLGVVLDPPRPGKGLGQLAVAAPEHLQLVVDDEAGGAGRALVDREDQPCESTNASVRRHASSDASANSSCLRSKKLCGAPS